MTKQGDYIYEGREWVLTGRDAVKKSARTKKERRLVEIRPADVDPIDTTYNKWVEMSDLYSING